MGLVACFCITPLCKELQEIVSLHYVQLDLIPDLFIIDRFMWVRIPLPYKGMAELVDALDLGSSETGTLMPFYLAQVRILSKPPVKRLCSSVWLEHYTHNVGLCKGRLSFKTGPSASCCNKKMKTGILYPYLIYKMERPDCALKL